MINDPTAISREAFPSLYYDTRGRPAHAPLFLQHHANRMNLTTMNPFHRLGSTNEAAVACRNCHISHSLCAVLDYAVKKQNPLAVSGQSAYRPYLRCSCISRETLTASLVLPYQIRDFLDSYISCGPQDERANTLPLEPEFGERAAGYALDAMAETGEPETIIKLFLDLSARGFGGEEYRGSSAHAMSRLASRDCSIGAEVAQVLERWLASPIRSVSRDEAGQSSPAGGPATGSTESSPDREIEGKPGLEFRSVIWDYGGVMILPGGEYLVLEALIRVPSRGASPSGSSRRFSTVSLGCRNPGSGRLCSTCSSIFRRVHRTGGQSF
jgi:hypothetical protein